MSARPPVFHDLIGQEHASRFLSAIARSGEASHAYLFLGPRGAGKTVAARAFAAALLCEDNGCGGCATCEKAARSAHPDLEMISPTGSFITVDQIREVGRRLNLRPHESRARVFIVTDAEAFNSESANAFLKSLEEPPSFVYFILLASREDRVLPTLVSRCQPVRFGPVPAAEIETHLLEKGCARPAEAKAYAHLAAGNLELAISLATDSHLAERRRHYIAIADNLAQGAWEGGASQLITEVQAAAAETAAGGGAASRVPAAAAIPEGFITATKKQREDSDKRLARAAQGEELRFALGVLESWFHDMMVMAVGAGKAVLNKDFELELEDRALASKLDSYRRAAEAIRSARAKLSYNVDMELALMALFSELMEVL
jgi:DNA polymerase-3 subunit delta'